MSRKYYFNENISKSTVLDPYWNTNLLFMLYTSDPSSCSVAPVETMTMMTVYYRIKTCIQLLYLYLKSRGIELGTGRVG